MKDCCDNPMKGKPKKVKKYDEVFETKGQKVTEGGKAILMANGRRFTRTVLPSSTSAPKPKKDENES